MNVALIDGDIAAYRVSAAAQRDIDWGDGDAPVPWVNPKAAAKTAGELVNLWTRAAGAKRCIVALTGHHNFRSVVYPEYKMNRSGKARPVALREVKDHLREKFATVEVDGLEADDLLGMLATMPKAKGKHVVVTIDKDLRNVPGMHLNPLKDGGNIAWVSEAEANRFWFHQALTGDPSDGYPGCPGIGPKKADVILGPWDGLDPVEGFKMLLPAFVKAAKGDEEKGREEALRMLRVARILRCGDYDKQGRVVRLWGPEGPEMLKMEDVIGG